MSNYAIVDGELVHCDELYHYGVVGMKWGVRKAYNYKRDINAHRYNQDKNQLKKQRRKGEISKADYKSGVKSLKSKYKADNKATKKELSKIKKFDKTKKTKDIYADYKEQALDEISSYRLKRGVRTVAKILSGATAASAIGSAGAAALIVTGTAYASAIGLQAAGITASSLALNAIDRKLINGIVNVTM